MKFHERDFNMGDNFHYKPYGINFMSSFIKHLHPSVTFGWEIVLVWLFESQSYYDRLFAYTMCLMYSTWSVPTTLFIVFFFFLLWKRGKPSLKTFPYDVPSNYSRRYKYSLSTTSLFTSQTSIDLSPPKSIPVYTLSEDTSFMKTEWSIKQSRNGPLYTFLCIHSLLHRTTPFMSITFFRTDFYLYRPYCPLIFCTWGRHCMMLQSLKKSDISPSVKL